MAVDLTPNLADKKAVSRMPSWAQAHPDPWANTSGIRRGHLVPPDLDELLAMAIEEGY
jgi:hypothetical protein